MNNIIERTLEASAFALLIAGGVALWYVTPANAETTAARGPSGGNVYTTKCSGSSSDCYQEASQYCRGPYQILGSESHGGGIFNDALGYGPVTYYTISYACGRSDGRLATFPRSGPEYVPPRPFYGECNGYYGGANCYGVY